MSVHIGTSGWMYPHWKGNFYPVDLPQKNWLRYYSKYFDTVEVNSSFYRQTRASTFEKWKSEVPSGFTFSIKGNRFITHIKRLKNCEEPLEKFFESASALLNLQPKHVILWQLPPSLKKDAERLRTFLELLPKTFRYAFEYRHQSWVDDGLDELERIFSQSGKECAVVLQDWHEWPIIEEPVGKFVYIRFHGKDMLYTSGYQDEELANWTKRMQKWIVSGRDVYAYFNNDAMGFATENAQTLKALI